MVCAAIAVKPACGVDIPYIPGNNMRFRAFRDFDDGEMIDGLGYDIVIHRRSLGDLVLPSGQLIACDPLLALDSEPFRLELTPGTFPVHILIAELRDEKSIAYGVVRFKNKRVRRWELALLPDREDSSLFDGDEESGFHVESSLAAYLDKKTADALVNYHQLVMPEDNDFERHIWGRIHRRRAKGAGWATLDLRADLQLPYGDGRNMMVFDAGFGNGYYKSYIGYDADEEVASIVTDFEVLDLRFPSFVIGGG